jgi:hypothetical protein
MGVEALPCDFHGRIEVSISTFQFFFDNMVNLKQKKMWLRFHLRHNGEDPLPY